MRGISHFLGSLAVAGMMLAFSAEAGMAQGGLPGDGASSCRVKVSRTAPAGVFDLTRQVLNGGKCVCRVTTGPRSQGGSAESALAGLLLRRTCSDAPLAAAGAAGGSSGLVPIIGGVAAAGGIAGAAAGGGSSTSP